MISPSDPLQSSLWAGQAVNGESVLFVEHKDGTRTARLLFVPSEIVRVESATGETTYQEGNIQKITVLSVPGFCH